MQRFTKRNPCPICGGWDEQSRGQGQRCWGFLSDDGRYVHCTRQEEGSIKRNESTEAWVHDLQDGQERKPIPQPKRAAPSDWKNFQKRIQLAYPYLDENRELLFEVLRLRDPKSFRQRRPAGEDHWCWGMRGGEYYQAKSGDWFTAKKNTRAANPRRAFPEGRRVLYRLPQILADVESCVFVVEGEKSVDRLYEAGADVATCSPGGAEKWAGAHETEYSETLRDRHVVILPDHDPLDKKRKVRVGLEHAKQVADSLHGVATSVRVLHLAELEEGQDVYDWLEADHSMDELLSLADQAPLYDPTESLFDGESPAEPPQEIKVAEGVRGEFELTDLGNARRLVANFINLIRFCDPLGGWQLWNELVWQADRTGSIYRLAHRTIDLIYEEATRQQGAARTEILKWAKRSQSDGSIRAMVAQAQHLKEIVVLPDQFDADPWLLNVKNGMVDLRTGEMRPHDREAYQTKIIDIDYLKDAYSKRWEGFLNHALPDGELQYFVQRAIGYSLTGLTREERLFFIYGQTSTSKGTFVKAIETVIGDYAHTADFETFLRQRNATGGPRNDIAALRGKRLVFCQEVDEDRRMAEATVKGIVSGDMVSARFLHQEFFEFRPVCAIWMVANHRPEVNDEDDAMWRRLLQVPFDVQVPEKERDQDLKRLLSEEPEHRQAILAWIIFGAKWWYTDGLQIPAAVREASDDYRREMDPLAEWWQENIQFDGKEETETENADAWGDYQNWADKNRVRRTLSRKAFTQRLRNMEGINYHRTGKRRYWTGFTLVHPQSEYASPWDQQT